MMDVSCFGPYRYDAVSSMDGLDEEQAGPVAV